MQPSGSDFSPRLAIRQLYDHFDAPVTTFDCGAKCAPYNRSGKPFCCDICHAVPAAYNQEWDYLQPNTDLWHVWRGDECPEDATDPGEVRAETPEHMLLLACQGPALCQRKFRLMSCRQFPFFPYLTSAGSFIGLAYEWAFESTCWVISNLEAVTEAFRIEFVRTYDALLDGWPAEYESYYLHSEEMREEFVARKRRIPLLHRRGGYYLISPASERLRSVSPEAFQCFGPYR